jgi:Arc/MetJ-type ribon-helix-helix transcriptional regulator
MEKMSISLSSSLAAFVESYRLNNNCKSRSQVIEQALELLREKALEKAYLEASQEADSIWYLTIGDGLSDTLFVPRSEVEYQQLVSLLDSLIDEVGEDESHPLASMMEVIGVLISDYESAHVPELFS